MSSGTETAEQDVPAHPWPHGQSYAKPTRRSVGDSRDRSGKTRRRAGLQRTRAELRITQFTRRGQPRQFILRHLQVQYPAPTVRNEEVHGAIVRKPVDVGALVVAERRIEELSKRIDEDKPRFCPGKTTVFGQ